MFTHFASNIDHQEGVGVCATVEAVFDELEPVDLSAGGTPENEVDAFGREDRSEFRDALLECLVFAGRKRSFLEILLTSQRALRQTLRGSLRGRTPDDGINPSTSSLTDSVITDSYLKRNAYTDSGRIYGYEHVRPHASRY